MRKNHLASVLLASTVAFGMGSCSNEAPLSPDTATGKEQTVTFTLRTPVGEKVSYSRALHDASEYAINSLVLYEYEINDEAGTSSLTRIMKYPDGSGKNTIIPVDGGDGTYTFSIIIPTDYDGKKYSYRFVANDATKTPALGSNFTSTLGIASANKTVVVNSGSESDEEANPTGDFLAEGGITMTGTAKVGGEEIFQMQPGIKASVEMTRIVSRIDVKYETPNLKITNIELQGAPTMGYLFPQSEFGVPNSTQFVNMSLNKNCELPTDYLEKLEDKTIINLNKAFYLYERANAEGNSIIVHIEYDVDANNTTYKGSINVPFRRTSEDTGYVNTLRNHLYTIVLGNGSEPVAGKISSKIIVDEWNLIEVDETLTDDDPIQRNQ